MVVVGGWFSWKVGWRCAEDGVFVRVCSGVLGGVGCQVACALMDFLPVCVRLIPVGVRCGYTWVCVYGVGRWWGCSEVLLMCRGWGVIFWAF